MSETTGAAPGWYPDPNMPGTRRYWDGFKWTDHVAPAERELPVFSTWKGIRIVAFGILAALATVFVLVRLSQPDDVDCSIQRLEVTTGERGAVDPACD